MVVQKFYQVVDERGMLLGGVGVAFVRIPLISD